MAEQEEYPPEVVATAASRVAAALAKDPAAPHSAPATHNPTPALPQQAPIGEPATQAGEKRTRTTVAKLLQKYQERVDETANQISIEEDFIADRQKNLGELRFKHQFWLDAIAEINAD